MLRHAQAYNARTGVAVPLVQANAEYLPLASGSFDAACSAFGAIPFVASVDAVFAEVHRVLRPGAPWVFSVTHPMRWIFPDDPGPQGLTVTQPYFDRTPYVEVDDDGTATYVEYHHTLGDYVRALASAGFTLTDLVEPEWPHGAHAAVGPVEPAARPAVPGHRDLPHAPLVTSLEDQQNARFAALDPQLPPIAAPPMTSEPLLVTVGGRKAGGLLTHAVHAPASWPALWGPAEIHELTAVPGETGAAGLAALLGAWRERLRGSGSGPDSGCMLTWPSRDDEASAVLLAHGFAPMTCLAVRPVEPPPDPGPARVRVRRAYSGDVEALTELRLAEWRYTSLVGTAVPRPDARARLRAEVVRAQRFSGLAWLAEDEGVAGRDGRLRPDLMRRRATASTVSCSRGSGATSTRCRWRPRRATAASAGR